MVKLPAGTTTISGHSRQSRKTVRARFFVLTAPPTGLD